MAYKKFTKVTEDFVCENCGEKVVGSGYTNHCPECLWSKHVDNSPGDRLNSCCALMKPIDLVTKKGQYVIIHECVKCGRKKNNKSSEYDNMEAVIELSQKDYTKNIRKR